MRYYTPLRYPGGKSKIANYMKLVFEINKIRDGVYIEPYAGGAGVALALLFDDYASEIYINDLNLSIYSFWFCVLNYTDDLCSLIRETPVNTEEWERQSDLQNRSTEISILELGFSTFFLNRTNRSGIISKAGIIGGKDQSGKWKIDARYNTDDLIKRIRYISKYSSRISLSNFDAGDFIKGNVSQIPNSIFYLDPPYYIAGQELYASFYIGDDHRDISESIKSLERPWIVSYDNHREIRKLYEGYRRIEYGLSYSAGEKYTGNEIMFFSNGLKIPDVESPTGLSIEMVNMASEPSLFPLREV